MLDNSKLFTRCALCIGHWALGRLGPDEEVRCIMQGATWTTDMVTARNKKRAGGVSMCETHWLASTLPLGLLAILEGIVGVGVGVGRGRCRCIVIPLDGRVNRIIRIVRMRGLGLAVDGHVVGHPKGRGAGPLQDDSRRATAPRSRGKQNDKQQRRPAASSVNARPKEGDKSAASCSSDRMKSEAPVPFGITIKILLGR